MRKFDTTSIIVLSVFLISVWVKDGFDAFWKIVRDIFMIMCACIVGINQIIVVFFGDSVCTLIFKSSITFAIVGLILELLCISRGHLASSLVNFHFGW
ncbi:MAG: hypothetical protein RSC85_01365 [Bacilli bacterium]